MKVKKEKKKKMKEKATDEGVVSHFLTVKGFKESVDMMISTEMINQLDDCDRKFICNNYDI